jgi:hypothetical protein
MKIQLEKNVENFWNKLRRKKRDNFVLRETKGYLKDYETILEFFFLENFVIKGGKDWFNEPLD